MDCPPSRPVGLPVALPLLASAFPPRPVPIGTRATQAEKVDGGLMDEGRALGYWGAWRTLQGMFSAVRLAERRLCKAAHLAFSAVRLKERRVREENCRGI